MALRTVRNKITGETFQVPEENLGNFGIRVPQPEMPQVQQPQVQTPQISQVQEPTEAQLSTAVFAKKPSPYLTKTQQIDPSLSASADMGMPARQPTPQEDFGVASGMQKQLDPYSPEYYLAQTSGVEDAVGTVAPEIREPMTWEGFQENVEKDIGSLISGVQAIPQVVGYVWQKPTEAVPKVGGAVIRGILEDYYNLITHPIRTLYDRPVTGTMDAIALIAPAVKAIKATKANKLAKIASVAGNTPADDLARVAAKAGVQVDDVKRVAQVARQAGMSTDDVVDVARIVGKTALGPDDIDDLVRTAKRAGLTAGDIDDIVEVARRSGTSVDEVNALADAMRTSKVSPLVGTREQQWLAGFTVPTKKAMHLNTPEVARTMIKYGVSGTPETLRNTAQSLTGWRGLFSRIYRGALSQTDEAVDVGNVANKVDDIARQNKAILKGLGGSLSDDMVDDMKNLAGIAPDAEDIPRYLNAQEAFDLAQQWEDMGWALKNKSTYLTDYPHYSVYGDMYLAGAKEITNGIDDILSKSPQLIQQYKTPEVVNYLNKISKNGSLADDFMKATTGNKLRAIQRDFVRLNKMIDLDTFSRNSAAAKLGTALNARLGGAVIGYGAGGIIPALIGTAVAPTVMPVVEKVTGSIGPKIATTVATKFGKVPSVAQALQRGGQTARAIGRGALTRTLPYSVLKNLIRQPQQALPPSWQYDIPSTNKNIQLPEGQSRMTFGDIPSLR